MAHKRWGARRPRCALSYVGAAKTPQGSLRADQGGTRRSIKRRNVRLAREGVYSRWGFGFGFSTMRVLITSGTARSDGSRRRNVPVRKKKIFVQQIPYSRRRPRDSSPSTWELCNRSSEATAPINRKRIATRGGRVEKRRKRGESVSCMEPTVKLRPIRAAPPHTVHCPPVVPLRRLRVSPASFSAFPSPR